MNTKEGEARKDESLKKTTSDKVVKQKKKKEKIEELGQGFITKWVM